MKTKVNQLVATNIENEKKQFEIKFARESTSEKSGDKKPWFLFTNEVTKCQRPKQTPRG